MKREFWAEFDLYSEPQKRNLIHYFVGQPRHDGGPPPPPKRQDGRLPWKLLEDQAVRQHMLAQLLASEEKCAKNQCKDYAKDKNGLQWWYYAGDFADPQGEFQNFLRNRVSWMASILGLIYQQTTVAPALPDLSLFPPGTWAVQVTFTLRKPYISRDDMDFYILDNPVKKEHVFKVPYVAPSQWKGALRAALVRELVAWWQRHDTRDPDTFAKRRLQLALLFGDEKGEEPGSIKGLARYLDEIGGEEAARLFRAEVRAHFGVPEDKPMPHFQGRLHFYPTFFDRIGLEVINPHDRKTGAGKHPIYFECVPPETSGIFTLLYVPIGGGPKDEATCKADLEAMAQGLRAMLTKYGFGAKTSSGYGVADVDEDQEEQIEVRPETWREDFLKAWRETHTETQGAQR